MTKKKNKDKEASITRSSAAEYLTFITAKGEGGVEAIYADEDVWLSQKMMAVLYDVKTHTINYHLKEIFADHELEEDSVIRKFRITASDGKSYDTGHYNLSATIAVGYKVNSERAVQFRKWATTVVREYTIKGFAMDDERLKEGGTVLTKQYFEEQLQRVREIRLREIPMTMQDWETRLNRFIEATDRKILQGAGRVTAEIARAHAESEFEKYRIVQDRLFVSDFDAAVNHLPIPTTEEPREKPKRKPKL